jgi:hypothetical protein
MYHVDFWMCYIMINEWRQWRIQQFCCIYPPTPLDSTYDSEREVFFNWKTLKQYKQLIYELYHHNNNCFLKCFSYTGQHKDWRVMEGSIAEEMCRTWWYDDVMIRLIDVIMIKCLFWNVAMYIKRVFCRSNEIIWKAWARQPLIVDGTVFHPTKASL